MHTAIILIICFCNFITIISSSSNWNLRIKLIFGNQNSICFIHFLYQFNFLFRSVFKCQRTETFHTILMGTNRVLQKNTEEPTVFLMLVPRGAMDTANQMVTLLVHCILIACQHPAGQLCICSSLLASM